MKTIPLTIVTKAKAAMLALWGLWLLLPWWNVFDYGRQYRAMADWAPEWVWGLLITLVGAGIYFFVNRNSALTRMLMLVEASFWMFMGLLLILGDWRPASSVVYASLGLMSFAFYLYSAER